MMGASPVAAATTTTAANKSRPTDYTSEIENLCRDPMSLPVSER